ncbi:SMP-30/gluconolaconase/LRE domain-containing protein [Calothrix parasitica NIES-267]|uniref:SMP-30/gluconolaconase/LRE domain-containing protein n=1 Tax=Calothrix parasitica NIES-267 TaxID=1973488 RepID=A0A1Z4LNT6_9CYAN|nr:SMP-30/gluconolaconase/LRE domain-containing protein [Calothrix parasitica NIES-267]
MIKNNFRIATYSLLFGLLSLQSSCGNNTSANTSEKSDIVDDNSKVEKLFDGFKFTEGPVWNPEGFLLFSDIPADTIYKWNTKDKNQNQNKPAIFRRPSGNTNGNAYDNQGRLISAQHNRKLTRTEKDGKVTVLAQRYENKLLNSPNDIAVKSDDSIYFTDPPYGIKKEEEELGFYGIYSWEENGNLTLLNKEMVRPNGIAFSPDEKKLYVSDSEKLHILVFDVKPDGTLSEGKVFAELPGSTDQGVPDGMKVDTKGNIYATGSGGVWIFSTTGQLLDKINVPEKATNLAWGNQDYKTLYITAGNSVYRIPLNTVGIKPGSKK